MAGIALFDPTRFAARYPEFSATPDASLRSYFSEAGLYLTNDATSAVRNVDVRALLLDMLTAHIATLAAESAAGSARAVGPLASATQGSVSTSFQGEPGTGLWFQQTQYGAAYWQATKCYRSFTYLPARTTV